VAKKPYFQFYPSDFLIDPSVASLDYYTLGVYIKILCYMSQTGGYLRLHEGGPYLPKSDCGSLLALPENECGRVIDKLIKHGCLKETEDGGLYNARMVRDTEEAKRYHEIKKKASEAGHKARYSQNKEKITSESCQTAAKQLPEDLPNGCQPQCQTACQTAAPSSSSSSSYINTSLSTAHARTNGHRSGDVETSGYAIEPPPGMPKNEDEAVAMAEMAGVPAEFTKEKAYPKILSVGFREGNTIIRHFGQWAKLYFSNWQNQEKRHQKTTQPFERKDNYMYNSKIKLPEL
jgi:hypothetical protein